MFVDASAMIAILVFEPEWREFSLKIERAGKVYASAVVLYEATTALTRITRDDVAAAQATAHRFFSDAEAEFVPIDAAVGAAALDAFARYGKGRHRAALNMGDCFAYACAKVHRVPLLCKGGDFKLTDIKLA